ncbi:MAG: hypothetical protein WAW05_09765 [Corynebacterium casei]
MNMKPGSWHFFIPLEAALPVPDGFRPFKPASGFVHNADGSITPRGDNVLFIFHQELLDTNPFPKLDSAFNTLDRRSVLHRESFMSFQNLELNLSFTVVEVVVSQQLRRNSKESSIESALDFALQQLNTILRAVSLIENQPVPLIRRETLPPQIPLATGVYEPHELRDRKLPRVKALPPISLPSFLPSVNVPPEPSERLEGWVEAAILSASIPAPFSSFANFRLDAQYFHESIGDYRISCILFASACEALFNQLLLHMLWEDGFRPEEAALHFFQSGKPPKPGKNPTSISVTGLVKQRLHPKFSASSWENSAPPPLQNWITDIAFLRNNVIHEAHTPTAEQMDKCVESFTNLLTFVSGELYKIRRKYPITALSFLGEVGLKEKGDWNGFFEQLETNLHEVSDRYQAFQMWAKHVGTFRKQPLLINSPVKIDESRMYLVQSGNTEEVFAVHSSTSVATKIPVDLLDNSKTYEQLRSHPDSGLDPRIIVSQENEKFPLPDNARWDLYAYDVLPGPSFIFTDLKKERDW